MSGQQVSNIFDNHFVFYAPPRFNKFFFSYLRRQILCLPLRVLLFCDYPSTRWQTRTFFEYLKPVARSFPTQGSVIPLLILVIIAGKMSVCSNLISIFAAK